MTSMLPDGDRSQVQQIPGTIQPGGDKPKIVIPQLPGKIIEKFQRPYFVYHSNEHDGTVVREYVLFENSNMAAEKNRK